MKSVYITQQGATARREGDVLVVQGREGGRMSVPVFDVDQVVFLGNVVVTPGAFDLLLDRGTDIVMLSPAGRYRGRFVSGVSKNIGLRLKQYDRLREPKAALAFAKAVVMGKLEGQRQVLLRHGRRHGTQDDLRKATVALKASIVRAGAVALDELRGCEGAGAASYFQVFGSLLRTETLAFKGRSRRPPLDPVNALLSLAYTLLARHVEAAVQVVGLDPYLGALHAVSAGRPSLVCDLMEEYRPLLVDPFVLAVVNKGALGAKDFVDHGPEGGFTLTPEALRWFLRLFERRMARSTTYGPTGQKLPWKEIILQQTRRFARFVSEEENYAAVEVR